MMSQRCRYPQADKLKDSIEAIKPSALRMGQPGPGRQPEGYDLLASGPFRYSIGAVNGIIPGAITFPNSLTTILRDPVEHFWHVWNQADVVAARASAWGRRESGWGSTPVTVATFLAKPSIYLERLPASIANRLRNGQVYTLGLSPAPTTAEVTELVAHMRSRFSTVMIADHLDESIVFLRRVLCWTPEDTAHPIVPFPTNAKRDLSAEVQQKIREFNWADDLLFVNFNSTLWSQVAKEINFQVEVEVQKAARAANTAQCNAEPATSSSVSNAARLKAMREKARYTRCFNRSVLSQGWNVCLYFRKHMCFESTSALG
jgi:hypothetical protein